MSHFLLIDNNAERRIRVSNGLRQQGIVVSEAENVKQAIDFSRKAEIDAFVIDTLAVELDGCRALETVRREGIQAPVLLLADCCDDRTRARCEAKGAHVLNKTASAKSMVSAGMVAV
jgi:CheY-like chemotaxis protein